MFIRFLTILLLCICWAGATAQEAIVRYYQPLFSPTHTEQATGARGVIRALVVGVDRYQHPGFTELNYARRDAEAFAAFLKTPAGGAIAWTDLVLLTNEQATLARVTDALDWMVTESHFGDKIIVFFSLYGFLEDRNDAQMLFYDSPPGSTEAGYLELSRLTTLLGAAASRQNARIFAAVELRPFHSNAKKLESWKGSDRRGGLFTEKINTSMLSKENLPDSSSIRSTFGNTLLRGLLGSADSNSDEKVYMPELIAYLNDHRDNAQQLSNCAYLAVSDKQDWVCKFSRLTKEKLSRQGKEAGTPILQLEVQPLDQFITEHADIATQRLYEDFILSIRLGNLLPPPDRCAAALLDSLLHIEQLAPVSKQLQRRMAVGYQDEAQQAINAYLQTSAQELARRRKDRDYYNRYPKYLENTLEILGEQHFMAPLLNLKRLYFEALALRLESQQTGDTALLPQAMVKLWQAVAIEQEAAFVYNEMGVVSILLKNFQAAEDYFKLALERSPSWSIPKANWSYSLLLQGALQQAEEVGIDAVSMSPWNPQPYLILAAVYIQKDSLQQAAEMCRRALIINPDAPDAHYNLACIHALQGNPAHALESLELALKHGFEDEELIRKDADLETLRGTVAFEALLAKFK